MMFRTITPVLSLIVAVLLYIFFISPQLLEIDKIRSEKDQYATAVETYRDFSERLGKKFALKEAQTVSENERLQKLVPSEVDVTQLLVDLKSLATQEGMLFGNISTDADEHSRQGNSKNDAQLSGESLELQSVDMDFEVIGTYEQFKSFLSKIEQSLNVFEVTKITYAATESPYGQFGLSVRTYALPKN